MTQLDEKHEIDPAQECGQFDKNLSLMERVQAKTHMSEDQIMLAAMLGIFVIIGLILVAAIIISAGVDAPG